MRDLEELVSGLEPGALPPLERHVPRTTGRLADLRGRTVVVTRFGDVAPAFRGYLEARGIDARLDLVGEDTLNGALQERAVRLGLADRIAFHGFVPSDRLPQFYACAHLYVQSSRHEAAGVAVLEAAASGVPVVGTAVGYVKDWARLRAAAVPPGARRTC